MSKFRLVVRPVFMSDVLKRIKTKRAALVGSQHAKFYHKNAYADLHQSYLNMTKNRFTLV